MGMSETYNVDCLMDDFAWSIYVLDVGIWFYLFLAALLVVVMFVWTVVLWTIVILTLIAVLIAGLCMGGGDVGGCDANCCASDCCVGGDCGGLFLATHSHGTIGEIYWAGFVPNTYNGTADDCCAAPGVVVKVAVRPLHSSSGSSLFCLKMLGVDSLVIWLALTT